MAKHKVFTFYGELNHYEPKIWRRFEINGEKTVAELAYSIMILFEMQASHLFSLVQHSREAVLEKLRENYTDEQINNVMDPQNELFKNEHYEFPIGEIYLREDERLVEPDTVTIQSAIHQTGVKFTLEYDYGDGWEIELVLEEIRTEDISLTLLPRALEGQGFGIIEDIGGVGGLAYLAEILKLGQGKEYEEFTEWLDSKTLDLEAFDMADMNFRLKKVLRIYRDSYEYNYAPTEQSLKLMLRDYLGKGNSGY